MKHRLVLILNFLPSLNGAKYATSTIQISMYALIAWHTTFTTASSFSSSDGLLEDFMLRR